MYYNPKVYHAASVDTDIASGKRVNYRIPGTRRTGDYPMFLSPYNKQSSLSTDGRAIGRDYYTTCSWTGNVLRVRVRTEDLTEILYTPDTLSGKIVDITITSGPNAGDSFHRTVEALLVGDGFYCVTSASDDNYGAVTKNDGTAWSWSGTTSTSFDDYNCKITF